MILGDFGRPGAHFGGPGAHFGGPGLILRIFGIGVIL